MTDYELVYPTDDVPLDALAKAALALAGPGEVTVVSGSGSQALRVPADKADAIRAAVADDTPKSASGPEEESPGPDALNIATETEQPARPARKATAKKTAAKATAKKTARSARSSSKEGDDQ